MAYRLETKLAAFSDFIILLTPVLKPVLVPNDLEMVCNVNIYRYANDVLMTCKAG